MQSRHDELRDELVAILGAGRELPPDADRQLAEAFIRYLDRPPEPAFAAAPRDEPHQPHYSLKLSGAVWGAALMFLFLLLVLDRPGMFDFIAASTVILALIAAFNRAFLYLSRYGWRMPHVHVTVAPPSSKTGGRG